MSQPLTVVQASRGVVPSIPKGFYLIPQGASITAVPVSAGSACVYISTSRLTPCMDDVESNAIGSGDATWAKWSAEDVTQKTTEIAQADITCAALVVSSGTWRLELVTHE